MQLFEKCMDFVPGILKSLWSLILGGVFKVNIIPKIVMPGHKKPSGSFARSKNSGFLKVSRSPTPWRPLVKCLNNCFCIKNRFEPFSRGLQGVGDLLAL